MGTHGKYIAAIVFILTVSLPLYGYTIISLLQQSEDRATQIDEFLAQRTKVLNTLNDTIQNPPEGYRLNKEEWKIQDFQYNHDDQIRKTLRTQAWKYSQPLSFSFEIIGEELHDSDKRVTTDNFNDWNKGVEKSLTRLANHFEKILNNRECEPLSKLSDMGTNAQINWKSKTINFINESKTIIVSMRFEQSGYENVVELELFIHERFEPLKIK